ncbi:ABC transporter permease [Silvibacterium dinghuense]|uniref:ABC transporter permease n=1 Tax=Silvibacterium dinghuense TaxID=1560006 RepID=A0A4Q1SJL5_9BACT|nr:ABC transporter permease [Silvibacterium dinghuense]RXS97470.1 ABC transporter permease [Silvibacterium dinghuense]GGG99279.1 hypothetical protein GCM10011586_13480 [Silvibacterium dinghuense]
MRMLRVWLRRVAGIWRRDDGEFAAELESHLAMEIEDGVRRGLSPQEARRQVLIRHGGVAQVQQAYRERRGLPWLEQLVQDVTYGARTLRRSPGFTSVAMLTLALGIATTTTVFRWIDGVVLRPLGGVSEPGRLVALDSLTANGELVPNSYPDYIDFRDHLKLLEGIAVYRPRAFTVGPRGRTERVTGEFVSGNFFSVLGVRAEAGHLFSPAEYGDAPGGYPVAVISDRYWRSHYGGDPGIVGRTIRVDEHELTVVGVADAAFQGSFAAMAFDIWVPYMERPVLEGVPEWMMRDRQDRAVIGMARLKPGVTLAEAQQELTALAARMAKADADTNAGMSAELLPLEKAPFGAQGLLTGPLRMLAGICLLVLAIVCVNVANLLLARATVRQREYGTRLALGAGRWRLARQVLTECLLLTLGAAALGLVATRWTVKLLAVLLPPGQMRLALPYGGELRAAAFTMGLCLLTTVAAGVVPAMLLALKPPAMPMSEGGRGGMAGRGGRRLRSALVTAEVALALVALVSAGLFVRSFEQAREMDPGFDPAHVLLGKFYLAGSGYDLAARKAFCRQLAEKMSAVPGVTAAAYSDGVPLGFEPSWWEDLEVAGYVPAPGENMKTFRNVVSPGYLDLMKIPMMEGREFTEHDDEQSRPVMIVNQTFARKYFGGREAIGRRVHGWGEWITVVGVVKDSKYHYVGERDVPYFYVPFRQFYRADMDLAFYVRGPAGDPMRMLAPLQEQVKSLDPDVNVYDADAMEDYIGASLYPQRVAASLLSAMGALAMVLAAVGLYSVVAYAVSLRTREIGVRMALGAKRVDVLRMVIGQALCLALVGTCVGGALSVLVARAAGSLSFTTSAMGSGVRLLSGGDAWSLLLAVLGAGGLLCAVSVVASLLPARSATQVNPVQALRAE